ncbi:MAG: hypothetical protein KBT20_05810 [Bacteroidales bacterium]|nr:hypothetical protein [Candidatus Liminaster caballi]
MNNLTKYIAVSCAILAASLSMSEAQAATVSDETSDETATSAVSANGVIDLDVPNYLVRYLYRDPDVDEVNLDHWYDGWGLMFYWNPDVLWPASSYTGLGRINDALGHRIPTSVKGLGIAVSKDFTKSSAVRLGLNYSQVQTAQYSNLKRMNLALDYVWNISNTYYGYDLHRKNEWLLTMGGKGGMVSGHDIFVAAAMGLQYRKNIANNMSFFIEPQFTIYSDNYDKRTSFHDVDPGMNALIGLYFRLTKPQMDVLDEDGGLLANSFFQTYAGLARNDASSFTYDGLKPKGRRHLNFGFGGGVWFNPSVAARLGYFENIAGIGMTTRRVANRGYRYQTLRGARGELIFNPLSIFGDKPYIGRIGWEVSGGFEAGQIRKHGQAFNNRNDNHTFTAPFLGITIGSQLKYFLSDHYALFVEGRISNPGYKYDYEPGITGADGERIHEAMFSTAAGMEYYVSSFDRYARWKKYDTHEARSIERLDMTNRWFFEAGIGAGHPLHWGEAFRNGLAPQVAAAVGMNINDFHGVRVRGSLIGQRNFSYLHQYKWNTRIGADYMFNLTNLWWGNDVTGTRWSDIYLFAGPTLQVHPRQTSDMKNFFKSMSAGAEFGAQFTRRILPGLDVFVEPRYEINSKQYPRWDLMTGVKLYQWRELNEQYRDSLKQHANTWFMEVAPGLGAQVASNRQGIKNAFKHPDFTGKLAVGYRFNPVSSFRLNGMFWINNVTDATPAIWNRVMHEHKQPRSWQGKSYGKYDVTLGVDYMANLLNLWYGVDPYRRFNLRAFAGPTFSPQNLLSATQKKTIGVGFEGGLQASYSVTDNIDVMVEPRAETFFTPKNRKEHADIYAGVIFYNQRGLLPRLGYMPTDIDDHRTWFMDAALGLSFAPGGRKGGVVNHIDPAGHFGIGMHINNYSSVRARGSFIYVRNYTQTADLRRYTPEVSLEYMHNITNEVLGFNPYRRFDFSLFAGPLTAISGIRTSNWDMHWGFDAGAQLAWHINEYWDLFGEPRVVLSHDYASRIEALGGIAYRFNRRSIHEANLNMPIDRLYAQFLLGGQMFSIDGRKTNGNGRFVDFDYRLGYRLNKLFNVQGSVFADNHRISKRRNDIDYFGIRGEIGINAINMFNPRYDYYENRLNVVLSAGGEIGRLRGETSKKRTFGPTAAAQVQYRVFNNAWALLEMRSHLVNANPSSLPVTAQLGIQYDLSSKKAELTEKSDYYVQGGVGMFDVKGGTFELGFGYDATPVHGVRVMLAGGNVDVPRSGRWLSIDPDYVFNFTNMLYGHDDNTRHLDVNLLAGLSYTMRGVGGAVKDHDLSKIMHTSSYMGLNFGAQFAYNFTDKLSFYAEPRFTWLTTDSDMIPTKRDKLNLFTMFGVKYRLSKNK